MDTVRFSQSGNVVNCEGLLHLEGDQLRLEYQVVDGVFGVLKSGVRQVSIPLSDLASIELANGWFGGRKIVLQARRMEAVQSAPGMTQGRVELVVARGDREAARKLVCGLTKPSMTEVMDLDA
jgi:hypothetical protein